MKEKSFKFAPQEIALSAVALTYIAFAIAFQYPAIEKAFGPISQAWRFLGFKQHWGFFGDPPKLTETIIGIITLSDGTMVMWEPPRPSPHARSKRAFYNRAVKWETEHIMSQEYAPYLPQLSRNACLEFSVAGKKPLCCSLLALTTEISDPKLSVLPRETANRSKWIRPLGTFRFEEGAPR